MGLANPLFPVGLVVSGRRCLVVGGGTVAARKIGALLGCGARVTVVAPEAHVALGLLARDGVLEAIEGDPLDVQLRPYRAGEAADYRLVITATGIPEVDRAVHDDAEAAGIWVNSADDVANCTFVLPSVHRDGPVAVSVSTGGMSPALATWLRRRIAEVIGTGLGELAAVLEEGRNQVKAAGGSTEDVDWAAILDGPIPELVRSGKVAEARAALAEAIIHSIH